MRKEQVKKNPRNASLTTEQNHDTPKSLELSEGQLEVHFRRLNLAHTRRIYKEVAVRAEKESWSYRDFLALLLAEEVARRKQTRLQRCTRSAHFPFFKTIEEFDFTLQSTLRESLIGSYLGLDFVAEGRSLILHGKTGRGKTHLAVAIGYRAIQNGFETLFTTAAELIEDLSNASKRGHLQESLATYTHPHVLVIDEGRLSDLRAGRCQRALPCGERSAPQEAADDLHNQQATERVGKGPTRRRYGSSHFRSGPRTRALYPSRRTLGTNASSQPGGDLASGC